VIYLKTKRFQKKKKSAYIIKQYFQNILSIEDIYFHHDPSITVLRIFPSGWNYKPWDFTKPQPYYMTILEKTGSTRFEHFKLQ
jgi:hypothetical protein